MSAEALPSESSWIGVPLLRVEDARHLHGRACFVADVRLPGLRDVAFLRSQVAHGRLEGIEIGAGVDAQSVWTAQRLEGRVRPLRASLLRPGFKAADQPILAEGRVRYVGELIAAVVAQDRASAEDAVGNLSAQIIELPALVSVEQALADDAPRLHEHWPDNLYSASQAVLGDYLAASARADVVVARSFKTARVLPMPMETRGCVAHFDRGTGVLTLHVSCQRPHLLRSMLAEQLTGIDESRIRVIAPDVGGGFGGKSNLYPEEILLSAIALDSPFPVRWIEDRYEHFVASSHARQHSQHITAYASRAGELLAIDARFIVDGGAYSMRTSTAGVEAGMAARILPGAYRLKNYRYETMAVATNKTMVGPYRGVGRPAAVFAMERIIDETARALGMEPHDFRARNMIDAAEHPYVTATGLVYDSGDYKALLDAAVRTMDVPRVRAEQATAKPETRRLIGVGFSAYTEQTAHGAEEFHMRGSPIDYGFESARVRMDPSGAVVVATGILSHGQGLETTLAQIAAESLGMAPQHIRVRQGDTDLCPYGMGTIASRSIVLAGGAVKGAADRLAQKIAAIAGALAGAEPGEAVLSHGEVRLGTQAFSLKEIARIAYHAVHKLPRSIEPGLEVTYHYRPEVETGAYSSGVHAAKVAVDLDTGFVEILDYAVAEDCGQVVNPLIVDGQVRGGCVQGIGQALYEEMVYDNLGQPLTVNFASYLTPGAPEAPPIRILHRKTPSPFTVYGIKGVGEGGAIAPPAAIANAVGDALRDYGFDVCRLPILPQDIWAAVAAGPVAREDRR